MLFLEKGYGRSFDGGRPLHTVARLSVRHKRSSSYGIELLLNVNYITFYMRIETRTAYLLDTHCTLLQL